MATMGVRWTGGSGNSGLGDALAKAAKAYWGDPDHEINLALARSRLENDQYNRTLTEASTAWTNTREQADAAALQAKLLGQQDIQDRMLQFLNQPDAAAAAPAPVDVEAAQAAALPAEAPIPTPNPNDPVPVELGPETFVPTFPSRPAGPQLPMPGEEQPGMVAIAGQPTAVYPNQPLPGVPPVGPFPARPGGPALPQELRASVFAPRPEGPALPVVPEKSFGPIGPFPSRPELAGEGIQGPGGFQAALQNLLAPIGELGEGPQPQPPVNLEPYLSARIPTAPPDGTEAPLPIEPLPEPYDSTGGAVVSPLGQAMRGPGPFPSRPELPIRGVEEPVPIDADVFTGPPEAYEARPAPEAPVPLEPQVLPGEPVQGPPASLSASPAGPATATGEPLPAGAPAPTQQLMPGDTVPQPDGTVAVGLPNGTTQTFTADQVDGIAALIAFSNDPAGQFGGFSGRLDMMKRGKPTELNTSLISGQAPARSSTLGTDEEIRLQTEIEKVKAGLAPKPNAQIQMVNNLPHHITTDANGVVHAKLLPEFTAPNAPLIPGNDAKSLAYNELTRLNRKLDQGIPLTPDEAAAYKTEYFSVLAPQTISTKGPDGKMQAQTIITDPPDNFRPPDQLVPGPYTPAAPGETPAPAAAPAPAAVAPAPVTADQVAANQPAVQGQPLTVENVATGEQVPVKNNGGWTEPGKKPPVSREQIKQPGSTVVTTTYGEPKERVVTGEATKQQRGLIEAIPAMHFLNSILPGEEPTAFQNALDQWSATGISEGLLASMPLDDPTREYGRAILTFINAPKRGESGAAVNANEVQDYRKRFAMAPGGGNDEYLSARQERTQYLRANRMALTEQIQPKDLQFIDTELARYGIDLDWTNPRIRQRGTQDQQQQAPVPAGAPDDWLEMSPQEQNDWIAAGQKK